MTDVKKRTWKRRYGTFWSTGQVAELVGVSTNTVRRWIDSGKLEAVRLPEQEKEAPSERRVHKDVLREFLIKLGYTRTVQDLDAKSPPAENGKGKP